MSELSFRSRAELEAHQLDRLRTLLGRLSGNRFHAQRLERAGIDPEIESLAAFAERMPFTTKEELMADQEAHPPYGSNLSRPLDDFVRLHQTSSTTGKPLRWLDTAENWEFLKQGWRRVFEAAGVTGGDRVFVAFSFGPFLGLWLAFEAAPDVGALCLSGGALSSEMRLRAILANEATVLCCTPTYALRLGEIAAEKGIDLEAARVRAIIVGGEPGASIPATRARIEASWPGAKLHDHYGLTEVGPLSYQCPESHERLHVAETLFLPEVVDVETGKPLHVDGEATGELVMTTLGRADSPVLRYRTGDIVRPLPAGTCECGRVSLRLAGGVLARADDMVVVRGVNLYPTAIERIVRGFAEVAEYRVQVRTERGMSELEIEVEPVAGCGGDACRELCDGIEGAFRSAYSLRVPVRLAEAGALPRFELKAQRWVRVE